MKLTGLSEKVFLDRYSLKDEAGAPLEKTPEEMWRRVAKGIASAEKTPEKKKEWKKKFYDVMEGFKFLPGGRIFAGAGTGYDVTYYNCFVIPSPKDSRDGIMDNLKSMIEIMARGGGVGLNLSSLRPRGARVKKVNGFSSGPMNWAELYSVATKDIVQQGGSRRGALMLMLHDWHPDIEEFITVKQDLTRINGANLSVCLSDAFMEAVKKDANWDLIYPDLDDPRYDELWNGDMIAWKAAGRKVKVSKTIKAKYLWDLICTAAWRSAEPGLHFLERSNKESNTWYFEKLIATNPCLTGDTLVSTESGWKRVDKIVIGEKIGTVLGTGTVDNVEVHKNKPVFRVKLSDGAELRATAAHQFHAIKHGEKTGKSVSNKRFSCLALAELEAGDILRVSPVPMPENKVVGLPEGWEEKDYGFFVGILLGDGCITEKTLNRNIVKIAVNSDETEWVSQIRTVLQKAGSKVVRMNTSNSRSANMVVQSSSGGATLLVKQSLLMPSYSYEKRIPLEYQNTNKRFLAGLLDGLFSTDGNVNLSSTHPALRYKTTSKQLAQDVRRILLYFGIHGRIATIREVAPGHIGDRVIMSRHTQYEVIISGHGVKLFAENIGLSHLDKQIKLQKAQSEYALTGNTWLTRIVSIEPDGLETVYDIHEPVSDTWIAEGIVSRGCGEQPLSAWAVCNLGAMNLLAYVKDADIARGKAGWFDYEQFGQDVQVSMRFLDNVIDQTYYFLKENEQCAKDIRRTGLGIMGLGDTLIKMQLRYGAEESLPVIEKIFKTLRDNAYIASSNIAAEKGSFPKFDRDNYLEGFHIKALPKKIRDMISKQGIRNAVLLTIAPTGTTSLLAGVTSGIEPVYEFEFIRKSKLGVDKLYHPIYQEWKEAHPNDPRADYFVSANDLTPLDHVKVQAIAQAYIDSSISKTVNAPNKDTVEDVEGLYMAAYDMGLKGITYMRDGSRVGVLQREEKKEEKKEEPIAPAVTIPLHPDVPRPMIVEGVTYATESPVGKTYITINHDESGEPFEVFINNGKSGSDVMAMADALGRMISFILRIHSTVPRRDRMKKIVSHLSGIGGSRSVGFGENRVRSLPDAVAKVLAKYANFSVNGKVEDRMPLANGSAMQNGLVVNGNGHAVQMTADSVQPAIVQQLSLEEGAAAVSSSFETRTMDICPSCGSATLAHEEGCAKCYSCGYAQC